VTHRAEGKIVGVGRWIARISALLMAGLILLIFAGGMIGEGFQPLLHLTTPEKIMMVAFFAMWLGLFLGWKWELVGGLLTVCALVAFDVVNYPFSGTLPSRYPFLLIIAAPALLYLFCGWQARKHASADSA